MAEAEIAGPTEAASKVAAVEVKDESAGQSGASAEAAEAEVKDAAESASVLAKGEKVAAEKLSTIGWIKSIFKSR